VTQPKNDDNDAPPLSAEAAALAAQELGRHAAAAPSPAADQAASAAQMTERGPTLPAENDIEAFMATVKAQMADMQAQLQLYKQQALEAQAAAGTPMVVRYAEGARDKVTAMAAAHPDAPQHHFKPAVAAATALADAASSLHNGAGATIDDVRDAAAKVETFATRTHWRTWGKHVDWSAILGDVEETVEAGVKLAAAA
jgi:hypothetical protein